MRLWGTAAVLYLAAAVVSLAAPWQAFAEPTADVVKPGGEDPGTPATGVGYGALPGGLHVATAESLPPSTVELAVVSGYGYRKGLLGADHTLTRAVGDLAIAYAPVANLAFALAFDGRYDKHTGFGAKPDDGYVGVPRLLARFAGPFGRRTVGVQLGISAPGKDAPSIATSAISVDGRALLSYDAGFGVVSINAGYRLDNSAKSVDRPVMLSVADQVSLGVSEFSAALAGIALRVPLGPRAYVGLESSADVFVGNGAPGPILRGGGTVGVALGDALTLIGYVELAKVPSVSYHANAMPSEVVLVPYEPTVTGGIGLQARFGGPRRVVAAPEGPVPPPLPPPAPVEVIEHAEVSGVVLDELGKPVVGANVNVKLKARSVTAVTDGKGVYTARVAVGKTIDGKTELDDTGAEVHAEVNNRKPASTTVTLSKGINTVPPLILDPMLPPGQLRAVIINAGTGRPVAGATVVIDPIGTTATSGADGKLTVDLPPGQYKITVTARGLAQQQLSVNIVENGVAIKNIELHK